MLEKLLTLHAITDLNDPLLPEWLELYEASFPPNERLPVSYLQELVAAGSPGDELLAATLPDPTAAHGRAQFVGLVYYEFLKSVTPAPGQPVCSVPGFLWYMAVKPQLRSQGLGAAIYRLAFQHCQQKGCCAWLIEVEKPELAQTPEEKDFASRRIRFYQRQGARLLRGISYIAQLGEHQPDTPMHVMIHSQAPLTPQAAFAYAQYISGGVLIQSGKLRLE
ncbi:MAG TPA: GNAT family N-acetyltransferase [Anaerolineales bacterium]|nr:GNAT family N-acetyltransferase [Anaerolineales bacterium]